MDPLVLKRMHDILKDDTLSFIYQGGFDDSYTESLISISEYHLTKERDLKKLRKNVSFLIAESFQNIVRHGEELELNATNAKKYDCFSTRTKGDTCLLYSSNLMKSDEVPQLEEQLKHLNSLDKDQIKELYIETLTNDKITEKGGAGLGLIEMARKSKNPLEYCFSESDNDYSLFHLLVKIKKEQEGQLEDFLPESIYISEEFKNYKILMLYKGDCSRNTVLVLLRILDQNMIVFSKSTGERKKVYLALVEMLQNISKHGAGTDENKEGLFMIGRDKGSFYIMAGNYISQIDKARVTKNIDIFNQMSKSELLAEYRNVIQSSEPSEKEGMGLGFLNILRFGNSKLKYEFTKTQDGQDMFILKCQL